MPRPDREQSILDAAGQVFARGYHGASMDEIAGLADVSKPMLYAYFGSKEGLYVAYVDRTGRELLDRLAGATTPDDQPTVRLRAGILEFLAFIEEHRDGWQVLFGELTSIGPVIEEVAVLRRRIAQWIMAVLAGATGSGGNRSRHVGAGHGARDRGSRRIAGELVARAPSRAARSGSRLVHGHDPRGRLGGGWRGRRAGPLTRLIRGRSPGTRDA